MIIAYYTDNKNRFFSVKLINTNYTFHLRDLKCIRLFRFLQLSKRLDFRRYKAFLSVFLYLVNNPQNQSDVWTCLKIKVSIKFLTLLFL